MASRSFLLVSSRRKDNGNEGVIKGFCHPQTAMKYLNYLVWLTFHQKKFSFDNWNKDEQNRSFKM
ncbi:MAG TPA: hypothetical protein VHA56_09095 [Mucilaginibacter sp.]|nr:hypothetical protein [Mucilaginibacter sp.]